MNQIHDFFNELDYYGWDQQMKASISEQHTEDPYATGYMICFKKRGDDIAKKDDSDYVYHEYTHNVVYKIFNGWIHASNEPDSSQGRALDEAFPDYFACTKNGNATFANLRNIDSPDFVYPTNMTGNSHENSRIVSGACWDLRKKIGDSTANQLIFDALEMLSSIYNRPYYFGQYLDCVYICNDNPFHEHWIEWAFTTIHGIDRLIAKRLPENDREIDDNEQKQIQSPNSYKIIKNYPNPFNSITQIEYQIAELQNLDRFPVLIRIYNINGQLVITLVNDFKKAGKYTILWNGKDENGLKMPTGIYVIEMRVNQFTSQRKMIIMQ